MKRAPFRYDAARHVIGAEGFVFQWLAGGGRHVVAFKPLLDCVALVREAVGSEDGIGHEVAPENIVA